MHTMKLTVAAAVASLAPAVVEANVGVPWSFSGAPSAGLDDVSFPINMQNAAHQSGYYFAQQFGFVASGGAYTGLQPRPDKAGSSIVHAAFSSFHNGTTTSHPNCRNGADGGPGVSCSVNIASPYNVTYNLVVDNQSGTTWRGRIVNAVSGDETVIGVWTLPAGAGKIKPSNGGFIEYFLDNRPGGANCPKQPKTEVVFGFPTSTTPGVKGTIGKPSDYGECKGVFDFAPKQVGNSWDITYGAV